MTNIYIIDMIYYYYYYETDTEVIKTLAEEKRAEPSFVLLNQLKNDLLLLTRHLLNPQIDALFCQTCAQRPDRTLPLDTIQTPRHPPLTCKQTN